MCVSDCFCCSQSFIYHCLYSYLQHNKLTSLPVGIFDGLSDMYIVDLSDNPDLSCVPWPYDVAYPTEMKGWPLVCNDMPTYLIVILCITILVFAVGITFIARVAVRKMYVEVSVHT